MSQSAGPPITASNNLIIKNLLLFASIMPIFLFQPPCNTYIFVHDKPTFDELVHVGAIGFALGIAFALLIWLETFLYGLWWKKRNPLKV